MENVVLVIHLILALSLIGIVLLQRSEGGGLGMGSSGGGGGLMSARGAATALGKATWILAAGFIATSIALTIIAAEKSAGSSVLDRIGTQPAATETAPAEATTDGAADLGADLLPPTPAESGPVVPVVPAAPATEPAADPAATEPATPAPATDTTAPATTEPVATDAPTQTN